MEDKVFYITFGSNYTNIKNVEMKINKQLSGNLLEKIEFNELSWLVDTILSYVIEKEIKYNKVLKFLNNLSVSILKWVDIFVKDDLDKFSGIITKAKLITELTDDCLSIDNLLRLCSLWSTSADKFVNKQRPAGIEMSSHYYNILFDKDVSRR